MPKARALVPLALAVPLGISLVLSPVASAASQPASTPAPTAEPMTPDTAQEFLDTTVPELIERHQGTGAGVSIVADGEIVASEGYGFANSVEQTPIDPATTAMHTGSTSKSITAMAVLQLVDEGQVDLREDVNTYLPDTVRIDDTHPGEPVTPHHLLTHTGGFEENMSSYFVDGPEDVLPLEEHLATIDVARPHPPGRFASYSNYGLALAGLVVQEVSGVSFEDYVEQNVLEPLGMDNTAFGQADVLREQYDVATQHDAAGEPEPDFYLESVPAGVSVASADDMARFMLSLINKGELDGERVLSEESTELMLSRQDGTAPEVSGAGYGTWEIQPEPQALGHSGDWIGAHARYVVVPELGIGIYVAVNNAESEASTPEFPNEDLRNAIAREFLEQFAPETNTPEGAAAPDEDLGHYTGTYITTRTSESDFNQIMTIPKSLRVSDNGDGTLSVTGVLAVDDRWLPAGDGLFVAENGRDTIGFLEEDGEVVAVSTQENPEEAYVPAGLLEQPEPRLGVAAVALLVMLSATVSWRRPKDAVTLVARVVASLAAAGALTTVGLFFYGAADNTRMITWLGAGVGFSLPMQITGALSLATAGMAVISWIRGWWGTAYRVYYSIVALAAVLFGSVGLMYGLF